MEDYTRTEVTTYTNGVDNNRLSDVEDAVVTAFDSLDKIQNGDSDNEQIVAVTKTITSYSHDTRDISATPSEHTEEHTQRIHSNDVDLTNEADWRISKVVDLNHGSYLGDFENDSHQSDYSDSETPEVDSHPGHVDDSTVSDFFTTSPEPEDSEHRLSMRSDTEEVIRPYGGGLAVAPNPSRLEIAQESDTSFHNDDNESNADDGGYTPPPPVHSAITDSDVLITSEMRNPDDGMDVSGDVDNEFDVGLPEVPLEAEADSKEHEESGQGGMLDTVKGKVVEVRDRGLEYGGDAVNDKLNNISDDGLIGKAKSQIVEHNVPDVAKEKITEASDSVINDDNMIDSMKDKIESTGVLGSFGFNNETSNKDDPPTNEKAVDVQDVMSAEKVTNVESEPPTLEIDTVNALGDDMDYQLQEVDISQSNEDDFGKVFADHRQSMREGNTSPLFHQDASRFHSTGTLSTSDSKKVLKEEKAKNGSNYTVNAMPTDEERPQKGCASILKGFFCPKRGSWQPDSYF
ncbi:hypothetical protein LOTGIDRAFT_231242 [Lottia gigantea]|uniref:Uncharacterized protein n=1 Tax=Lottia gigantea TaxID=225164 RepID=V4AYX2_LOTGI|nr:hypothetical protein LOTGIDRAFT_231242 [Lottia gigantea]ESO98911.1 hypothetical protein LOTGIDRAFT_231242 [Lottia gigantea]